MAAKVICFGSPKGGSGKTLLTATFAAFLAGLGKKVLMIDTDAATNGLTLLHLKEVMKQGEIAFSERRVPLGVYEAITVDTPPEIIPLPTGVHLVPAMYAFKDSELVPLDLYSDSLTNVLKRSRDVYDFIFIDAQAGSDEYAQIAMRRGISDQVVIVSEYDPMSAAGVERLKGLMREDLTYVRTWVLLNKMLPDFVQSFSDFLEVAKYLSPIPWDADVVRAYARRRLALDMENGNEHTVAIFQVLRILFQEELEGELSEWMHQRIATIREPIADQYRDLERELDGLVFERHRIESRAERERITRRLVTYSLVFFSFLITLGVVLVDPTDLAKGLFGISYLSPWVIIVLTFLLVLPAVTHFGSRIEVSSQLEADLAKIRRREQMVEERLKKLAVLKQADFETLLKSARLR